MRRTNETHAWYLFRVMHFDIRRYFSILIDWLVVICNYATHFFTKPLLIIHAVFLYVSCVFFLTLTMSETTLTQGFLNRMPSNGLLTSFAQFRQQRKHLRQYTKRIRWQTEQKHSTHLSELFSNKEYERWNKQNSVWSFCFDLSSLIFNNKTHNCDWFVQFWWQLHLLWNDSYVHFK